MEAQRMELAGADRARYFVPTTVCVYLSAVCLVLIITSAFLASMRDAVAVTAAGAFGLCLTGGLGLLFWRAQRRDLLYTRWATPQDAAANYAAVAAAAQAAGWRIRRAEPARRFEADAAGSLLDSGERIAVKFEDSDVLVASICDPRVGFSLIGRRHCAAHRELVRGAVQGGVEPRGAA